MRAWERARFRSRRFSTSNRTIFAKTRPSNTSGSRRAARSVSATGIFITCNSVVKDADGNVVELHCTYDPATRGGKTPDGRKVKSTIHWVSAAHAVDSEVRLYDNLFTKENPNEVEEGQDFTANLNPNSFEVLSGCKVEPSLADAAAGHAISVRTTGLLLRGS